MFKELAKLYMEDREEFFRVRLEKIEAIIMSAPPELQPGLRATQKRWDDAMEGLNGLQRIVKADKLMREYIASTAPILEWAEGKSTGKIDFH